MERGESYCRHSSIRGLGVGCAYLAAVFSNLPVWPTARVNLVFQAVRGPRSRTWLHQPCEMHEEEESGGEVV